MSEKVNKESIDLALKLKKQLKKKTPEIFNEDKIDFNRLKEILGEDISNTEESYKFTWSGKKDAIKNIQTPSYGTLIPDKDDSIDFDDSGNLFIEGDNLEALKLLQKSYANKVKMIYIDPPYNTGGDFVYNDDFKDNIRNYLEKTGQVDSEGNKLTTNTESNGRFHSDWLSMMYPRLYLARNLLKEDGVIFVSIDDNEVHNLKMIMNEIFGEENFITNIIWQKKFSRANDATYFSTMHDNILCYCKNNIKYNDNGWKLGLIPRGDEIPEGYSNPDDDPRGVWTSVVLSAKSGSEKLLYEIETPSGRICTPPSGRYWSVNKDKFKELVKNNRIWFGQNGDAKPRLKTFLTEVQDGLRPNTIWFHEEVGHNQEGKQEFKKIFNDKGLFDGPKPKRLIKRMITISNLNNKDIVLDFFAGSGTTAHAVLERNKEEETDNKFILVQLPEPTDEESLSYKEGYETISDIAKERIRRVIKGYGDNDPIDDGFKVFKLDKSNYKVWEELEAGDVTVEDVEKQLKLFDDTLIEGYREIDVIYEIIIKEGYSLNSKIKKLNIDEYDVYKIEDEDKSFYVTLEEKIDESIIENFDYDDETLFVCLDSALKDSDKINISLRLNLKSI
jgi:adenine-specific DNA-methyltransferase